MGLKIKMPINNQYDTNIGCNCKKYTAQKGFFFVVGGTFDKITSGTQDSKGRVSLIYWIQDLPLTRICG
jgi:hypothetical protein